MAKAVERLETSGERVKNIARLFVRHENGVLGAVLIVLVAGLAVLTKGLLVDPRNIMNVLLQSSYRGMAAIGETFVLLTANVDVSIGGLSVMSMMIAASLMTTRLEQNIIGSPVSMFIALPIMIMSAIGIGALNGTFVTRVGVPGLIVTLAMWQITQGISESIMRTGPIWAIDPRVAFLAGSHIAGVPLPAVIFAIAAVVTYIVLNYTAFGREFYAVGGNQASAWLAGINPNRIIFWAYLICGMMAGFAGMVEMSRNMSGDLVATRGLELDAITAAALGGVSLFGGRGSIIGVVIGVVIIGVVNNGMSLLGVHIAFQGIIKGAILIAAVAIDTMRQRR